MPQQDGVSTRLIVIILGMLAAFAPFATDTYLSAFGQMADYFAVPERAIETTLSAFFLGLSVGQAIYGPLIDRFGRRLPLLFGILIFGVSTCVCLLTTSMTVFIVFRFVQAVGGCAGMIIGRAIVRDLFNERDSARAFSSLLVVMTLAPIVAPVLGGAIIALAGWHAVFYFMLAFSLFCAVLVWFFIPETLVKEKRRNDGPKAVLAAFAGLMSGRAFIVPALVGALAQASMFAFITGSPFVLITIYGVAPQTYGFMFALIACALIVGSQVNRMLLRTMTPEFLLGAALILTAVAATIGVAVVATGNLVLLMTALWLAIGALGLIGADSAAIAMSATGEHPGSGSALIGVLQFGCAFITSSLVAATQNGTAYPMMLVIAACGLSSLIIWFWSQSRASTTVRS